MKRETIAYERVLYYTGNKSPMYFAFRLKIKGRIKKQELETALTKIRSRHPLAGVRVEMTAAKKQYITTENVPPIPLKEYPGREIDWKTLIKKELGRPFDIFKGPMIRVFLIQREGISDLVAIFHHALCDGLSAVLFLHEVLLFLSAPARPVVPFTEAPGFTQLIRNDILETIKKRGLPDWLKNKEYLKIEMQPPKDEPFPQPDFALYNWFFTGEETGKIIRCAKKTGVSVHALVGAVLLSVFAREWGETQGYERKLQSPLSFKPFFSPEAKDYFGLFNGLLTVTIDCSPPRSVLEIAREIFAKLKGPIDNFTPLEGYYYFNEYFLEGLKDPELYYANRPSPPMDYDFSLSNLGKLPTQKNYGSYAIEKLYGPIFSAIRGERVIGLATHQEKMFFTCIYDKDCFADDLGRKIIERALEIFRSL